MVICLLASNVVPVDDTSLASIVHMYVPGVVIVPPPDFGTGTNSTLYPPVAPLFSFCPTLVSEGADNVPVAAGLQSDSFMLRTAFPLRLSCTNRHIFACNCSPS